MWSRLKRGARFASCLRATNGLESSAIYQNRLSLWPTERIPINKIGNPLLQQLWNRFSIGQNRDRAACVIVEGLGRIDAEFLIDRGQ